LGPGCILVAQATILSLVVENRRSSEGFRRSAAEQRMVDRAVLNSTELHDIPPLVCWLPAVSRRRTVLRILDSLKSDQLAARPWGPYSNNFS
jgi:hypothetical protein